MTAPPRTVTRTEVEDLLFHEAELLDAWDLDTWLTLYTEDSRYVVPVTTARTATRPPTSC